MEKFEYNDWVLVVDDNESTVEVYKDGETRVYDIKEKILRAEQDSEYPMYIDIFVSGGNYYSFKFEEENALIADIYDEDEEYIKPFAQHYFGEDDYDEDDIHEYEYEDEDEDDYDYDDFYDEDYDKN